jgi:hypothetical protein
MAKGKVKGKKKSKAKAKARPKSKAKARPKPKAKARPKPKAKPRAKAKPRPKPQPKPTPQPKPQNMPITITPLICDDITGNTGDKVFWQQIPANGCQVTKGLTQWPFDVPYPIPLTPVSNTVVTIVVPKGVYQIVVGCCPTNAPKTVTVP